MVTEEGDASRSPLDDVRDDLRRALVRRVAATDRNANRDIYDALETERWESGAVLTTRPASARARLRGLHLPAAPSVWRPLADCGSSASN